MDNLESVKKALSEAIKEKDPKKVELLINQVDINSYIEDGQAPLHLMANYDLDDANCREIFNLITTQPGIDINLPVGPSYQKHFTILHIARKASLVKMLLTIDKINVNSFHPRELFTPLFLHLYHVRRYRTHEENVEALQICKLLIENGADVNRCDHDYTAPIHMLTGLDLRNTEMKEFYDYFTSRPELDVNVRDYEGRCLLEPHTNSRHQLEIFMDLPWKPCFLLDAFNWNDKLITEKVYQKWDQMDYAEVMNDLIIENKVRLLPGRMDAIWKYLYKNKYRTSDNVFQTFFTNLRYTHFHSSTLTLEEYKLFIELYYKYAQVNLLGNKLVRHFFLQFKDCDTLRTIIKQIDSKELTSFKLERHPFLYLITHFQCDLNETLGLLKLDYSYSERSLFHLQHISRYCTLPKHLFGSFTWHETNYSYLEKHESGIEEIKKVVFKPEPKSLLEFSRNAARKFLACKYNVTSPEDMDFVLNQIGIPRVIKKFLMLEIPIHPDIPVPQMFLST